MITPCIVLSHFEKWQGSYPQADKPSRNSRPSPMSVCFAGIIEANFLDLHLLFLFCFVLFILLIYLRKREHKQGRERKKHTPLLSMEHDIGPNRSQISEIRTWVEAKHLTDWTTQEPLYNCYKTITYGNWYGHTFYLWYYLTGDIRK